MLLTDEDLALPLDELKQKITDAFPDYKWYTYAHIYKYKEPRCIFAKYPGKYPKIGCDSTKVLIWDWDELLEMPKEQFKVIFMNRKEFEKYCYERKQHESARRLVLQNREWKNQLQRHVQEVQVQLQTIIQSYDSQLSEVREEEV